MAVLLNTRSLPAPPSPLMTRVCGRDVRRWASRRPRTRNKPHRAVFFTNGEGSGVRVGSRGRRSRSFCGRIVEEIRVHPARALFFPSSFSQRGGCSGVLACAFMEASRVCSSRTTFNFCSAPPLPLRFSCYVSLHPTGVCVYGGGG